VQLLLAIRKWLLLLFLLHASRLLDLPLPKVQLLQATHQLRRNHTVH
jgi:hypothetical protein